MGWGKSWEEVASITEEAWSKLKPLGIGIDLGAGDSQTVLTIFEDGQIKQRIIPNEELYINLKPTHDPYTNPNAHIYYECKCGAILDPKTKSFAALNNHASEKGWKVRFCEHGYTPYCVKCGEEVE